MKRLLASLLFGQSLRHRPVALRRGEQRPVRAVAITGAPERDVTSLLFPVSLNPLLIGLSTGSGDAPAGALTLRMEDVASSRLLGTIDASPAGSIEHRGIRIDLLQPTRSSVRCVPAPVVVTG